MSKYVVLTEEWIKEKLKISNDNLEDIKTLIIQGNYEEKITHLGNALLHFSRLKILDLSRNCLKSVKGLDHIISLEVLNLYYNCIDDLNELRPLEHNVNLKDLDLRLNPVSRLNSDYRLYLTYLLPKLKTLDCRSIRDAERKAAIAYFTLDNPVGDFMSNSPAYKTEHSRNFKEPVLDSTSNLYKRSPNHSKPNPESMVQQTYDIAHPDDHDKGRLAMDDSDPYELTAKANDPWTNHFLRVNSKPNGNIKSLDPARGIKQAEFYGKKERLQTEIDLTTTDSRENGIKPRGQDESIYYSNGKGIHEISQTTNRMQNEQPKGPRIPPRGKRYMPSSTTLGISTGTGMEKQLTTESNLQTSNRGQPNLSPQKFTNDPNRYSKSTHEFNGNTDNSFLLVLKNFIEEAVSESFARYKSNEKKNSSVNGQSNLAIAPPRRMEQMPTLIGRSEFTNGDRKRDSLRANGQNIRESYTSPDIHGEFQDLRGNNDDRNKKVKEVPEPQQNVMIEDLVNENLRLADEVERLKTRLKVYEELAVPNPSAAAAAAAAATSTTTLTTINTKAAILPSTVNLYDDQVGRKIIESQTLLQTTPLKRAMSLMSSTPNISQLPNSKRPDYFEFEQALLLPSTMHHALKFHNSTESHATHIARPKFII